ncbi:YihA family ribosome biogenesis GTP-binding protein [Parasulfuritortus cantonensis]|uniref:Probable GTP-binding protein EngB n=1 Tax=Parasulfuritortus cantonensis TaxID=2528202 RepID=A0A4R1BIW6_9PROT|nr:ribosome biogenesis GTP-binding protein YihA/YsxC [Parasulfuritortus cantonensis]TCJ17229.1 YihA family ribosome biogenesis GTP-binding protein [Parasulfuritortus cantonensis]
MLNASFFITVAHIADLPTESLAEVAFAGRSNAGKSSAINTLALHKRLAFVSKTPGRTQHLNFFRVADQRFLVDLPGYGFARAPLEQQRGWQSLIGGYLASRAPLRGLVLIMDARHPFTDLDVQLLEWFRATGKPVLVLLSKSDKLNRSECTLTLRKARATLQELGLEGTAQLFSSTKRVGVEEAEAQLRIWLDMPKPIAKPATGQDGKKKPGSRG